jgi:hypothetical protein
MNKRLAYAYISFADLWFTKRYENLTCEFYTTKKNNYLRMKRISFLFLIAIATVMLISSCADSTTYAQQLKVEKDKIAAYIALNNINVVSQFPTDKKWSKDGKDIYVLTESGLYFHLDSIGDVSTKDSVEIGDQVTPRYKEYTMDNPSMLFSSHWSTLDDTHPSSFVYGSAATIYTGFQEAVAYMKRNNSEARIIVPSKIGFYYSDLNAATPYFYRIKIKIQK